MLAGPLPYADADRVVLFRSMNPSYGLLWTTAAPANLLDWQAQAKSFEAIAGYRWRTVDLTGGDRTERLRFLQITETVSSISLAVQQAIAFVETDAASGAEEGFAKRAAAIEFLEIHVLDRLQYLEESAGLPSELLALRARAAALTRRLEAANERVLQKLRRRIRTGAYTAEGLKRALIRQAGPPEDRSGYDALDLLVGGVLGSGVLPQERAAREPEMVAYQPTPARTILELVERANIRPTDLLYDLGSGLGRVVILVALLSGARARGIEFEPAYCEYARRCVRRLNLTGVEFLEGDVREAPLVEGTVYFLYTPFRGAFLRHVLERLRAEASERPIRVCTYGPCTPEVAGTSWLRPTDDRDLSEHEVAVFVTARRTRH